MIHVFGLVQVAHCHAMWRRGARKSLRMVRNSDHLCNQNDVTAFDASLLIALFHCKGVPVSSNLYCSGSENVSQAVPGCSIRCIVEFPPRSTRD